MRGHGALSQPSTSIRVFPGGAGEKGRQRRSRGFVELRAHRLGALRAVRPHVLHVRCGRQIPCGLAGQPFHQPLFILPTDDGEKAVTNLESF